MVGNHNGQAKRLDLRAYVASTRALHIAVSALFAAVLSFTLPACAASANQSSGQSTTNAGQTSATSSSGQTSATSSPSASNAKDAFEVTVTVDATIAGGEKQSFNVKLNEGQNAYDALVATGLKVDAQDSAYGLYVAAIEGKPEAAASSTTGWTYEVDGQMPNTSATETHLSKGQTVSWKLVNF